MKQWILNCLGNILAGIIGGLIVVVVAAMMAPAIAEFIANANPTCADARGLKPIQSASLRPSGSSHDFSRFGPDKAIDGYGGTIWMPPMEKVSDHTVKFDKSQERNILDLEMSEEHDVKLVCVVNGLTTSFTNYVNYGHVTSVSTWTNRESDARVSVIRTLGQDDFTKPQAAGRSLGRSRVVHIRLDGASSGQTVENYDPDVCFPKNDEPDEYAIGPSQGGARFWPGCIIEPTDQAGLSEVILYESDK